MPNLARELKADDIRLQVIGLLDHFRRSGQPIHPTDALHGLIEAAGIYGFTAGVSEGRFAKLARQAHRNARLAATAAAMPRKLFVPGTATSH